MLLFRKLLILSVLSGISLLAPGQRVYKSQSVLATGNWFRISVSGTGIYKLDLPFLNSLGISGSISSSSLRVFGNGGGMLSESNSGSYTDDLVENPVWVADGGDGILNGSDYVLFYAPGPHHWIKDSLNGRFSHRKNLYSEKAYYYINLGGNGKRIVQQNLSPAPAVTVNSFNERYFHELDTVNFLSSGKEWFGEELANIPGRSLTLNFNLPLTDLIPGQPATIVSSVAARSINIPSRFSVLVNNQPAQQLNILPVSTGIHDLFAQQSTVADPVNLTQSGVSVQFTYTPGSFNSQGWLNWFEFFCRRSLTLPSGGQLSFRDWNSVGNSAAEFVIGNAVAATEVWEVTDPLNPVKMNGILNGNQLRFTNDALRLREYIAFSGNYLTPRAEGRVANQNLHLTSEKDYFIVTWPAFQAQAERLARFHEQRNNLRIIVVSTDQVFHEFGGGTPDPTAIREFIKMYFDRYSSTWNATGKYLLLFGKASFDYKDRVNNNTNLVPSYQTVSSLDPLGTYTSDDFFGFLEDGEDINSGLIINTLDIGIGRVPAKNTEEARNFVDKVENYHETSSFGAWRNNLNFIADDEDFNLHLQDAEVLTGTVKTSAPVFNPAKIYLDAFLQEGGSSGGRYPGANAVINSNIYNGTLIWNYSGHGGALRLAEETVVDQQIVNNWNNAGRLPLFITATCDFAPYDNPAVNSLGENLLVRPKTGAIALMTTTRVVFAYSNRIMNNNYLRAALEPDANHRYKTLGEAVKAAKNFTYQTSGDITNNRKFVLLGDPAMTLGFPRHLVKLTSVNGKDVQSSRDTLSAAEFAEMDGEITDRSGSLLTSFNGTVSVTVYDKVQQIQTRANDPTSQPVAFQDQTSFLFRGRATARNGKFSIRFRMPRDINFQYGSGKVSLYAHDAASDGNGFSNNVVIGGISSQPVNDSEGPEIRAFMNDDRFVNGGLTDEAPVLILKLADSSGINTGGSGINHDIVATLDNDPRKYFILNNFYESDLDEYTKGTVRFQLPVLEPGPHTLKIKAWDVLNNSNEIALDFTVVKKEAISIAHVLNYPNPFTSRTSFWFEHNQPGLPLNVKIEIFTVSGKLIKTLSRAINTAGNRSNEVEWDGRDDFGNRPGRGVYIYRLLVTDVNGKQAGKWEKLTLLH